MFPKTKYLMQSADNSTATKCGDCYGAASEDLGIK